MQHTPTSTADGSSTLQLTQFGETYHSRNGAYTEAMHIYIKNGLEHLFESVANRGCAAPAETPAVGDTSGPDGSPVHLNIFDVGLGTGLNCILTWVWQQQLSQAGLPYPRITYYGIEKYPIHTSEIEQFNYPTIIAQHTDFPPDKLSGIFHLMHNCPWEKNVILPNFAVAGQSSTLCSPESGCTGGDFILNSTTAGYPGGDFILHKTCADIADLGAEYYREAGRHSWGGDAEKLPENGDKTGTAEHSGNVDAGIPAVVYYDTFSPATQPNLWDETIFRNIASGCTPGSLLVTYCSKGTVKHALRSAGFTLERLPGPPGKRHILRGRL